MLHAPNPILEAALQCSWKFVSCRKPVVFQRVGCSILVMLLVSPTLLTTSHSCLPLASIQVRTGGQGMDGGGVASSDVALLTQSQPPSPLHSSNRESSRQILLILRANIYLTPPRQSTTFFIFIIPPLMQTVLISFDRWALLRILYFCSNNNNSHCDSMNRLFSLVTSTLSVK